MISGDDTRVMIIAGIEHGDGLCVRFIGNIMQREIGRPGIQAGHGYCSVAVYLSGRLGLREVHVVRYGRLLVEYYAVSLVLTGHHFQQVSR